MVYSEQNNPIFYFNLTPRLLYYLRRHTLRLIDFENTSCIIQDKVKTWEQRKLGDFGKATGGTSIESEFSEDGKYKVISIGSYSEDSVYRDQGIRAIESEKTKNRILNEGDLTMILNDKTASGNIITGSSGLAFFIPSVSSV